MKRHLTWMAVCVLSGVATSMSLAQAPGAPAPDTPPPAESPSPAPLPGEEVMRPTTNGLRFSPNITRAFALGWMAQNLNSRVDLTPEQTRRMSASVGERISEIARDNPRLTEQFFEGIAETIMHAEGGGKLDPAQAQRFAERARPIMPLWDEFLRGVEGDGREILEPGQQQELQKVIKSRRRKLERFGAKMDEWAQGQYNPKERALEQLFDDTVEEDDAAVAPGAPKPTREVSQARRRANWQSRSLGSTDWQRFLMMAKATLKFTPEQSAQADQLLVAYREKAAGITTAEWRRKIQQNRVRSEMRWNMQDVPTEPWLFHIEREYEALIAPLTAVQKELYGRILALATPEQRAAVVEDLAGKAAQHGVAMSESDRAALLAALQGAPPPASQPASAESADGGQSQ